MSNLLYPFWIFLILVSLQHRLQRPLLGVFRDVARTSHRLETFLIESWSEHMRQHARLKEADRATKIRYGLSTSAREGPWFPI